MVAVASTKVRTNITTIPHAGDGYTYYGYTYYGYTYYGYTYYGHTYYGYTYFGHTYYGHTYPHRRAMGVLAMSRALGDLFLKPYVSAEPDVSLAQ